nr:unnamed protein product [Callosobruchus analis]
MCKLPVMPEKCLLVWMLVGLDWSTIHEYGEIHK